MLTRWNILILLSFGRFITVGLFVVLIFSQACSIFKSGKSSSADSLKMAQAQIALVDTEYFLVVEKMPEFQGGDINTFISYLKQNIKYPQAALNKKKQGMVAIQFGVDCYGSVQVFSVLKSSGTKLLDNEAKRAIKASPKWKPARLDNKSVGKLYVLQIKFNYATKKVEIK